MKYNNPRGNNKIFNPLTYLYQIRNRKKIVKSIVKYFKALFWVSLWFIINFFFLNNEKKRGKNKKIIRDWNLQKILNRKKKPIKKIYFFFSLWDLIIFNWYIKDRKINEEESNSVLIWLIEFKKHIELIVKQIKRNAENFSILNNLVIIFRRYTKIIAIKKFINLENITKLVNSFSKLKTLPKSS